MEREQMERMLFAGHGSSLMENAERYFERNALPSQERLWVAVMATRAAASLGKWGAVVQWAERALSMQMNDPEALGWTQLFLGVASLYLGNVYRAEKALAAFERLTSRTPALKKMEPFGEYNWALLLRFMKRFDEEIDHLRRAALGFERIGLLKRQAQCYLAVAWSYLLRGMAEQGVAELKEAEPYLTACEDEEVHTDKQLAWALYESLVGNVERSDQLCAELLGRDGLLVKHKADAYWLMGCNARARGEFGLAVAHAAEANHYAVQDFWPPQIERIAELTRRTVAN